MFKDIVDFLAIFLLVVFSFGVGLQKLYHYYKDMVRVSEGVETRQSDAFISWVLLYGIDYKLILFILLYVWFTNFTTTTRTWSGSVKVLRQ